MAAPTILVTQRPPSLTLIADVIQHAVEAVFHPGRRKGRIYSATADGSSIISASRWRFTGPIGATIRNSTILMRAAAVPLACPEMDAAMLMKLARYAIQSNFGRERHAKDQAGL